MIKAELDLYERICQGDIYCNIEYLEGADIIGDMASFSKIVFPLVYILTQDCDLEQDHPYRSAELSVENSSDDKKLLSVILAPIYNEEHFLKGEHLSDLGLKMRAINKMKKGKWTTQYNELVNNTNPRYHFLEFGEEIPIVNSVIDFKHYFTISVDKLLDKRTDKYVCKVSELYREQISQRFAYFLSRIGLPTE